MKRISLFFITTILFFTCTSLLAQSRCFTYDTAGNRTTRAGCSTSLNDPDGTDALSLLAGGEVAKELFMDPDALKFQVLDAKNDISDLIVFPNPAVGTFYIKTELQEDVTIWVYDLTGKLVASYASIPERIELTHLPNGSYALLLKRGETIQTTKIIISK